jgi:hypothetical protein
VADHDRALDAEFPKCVVEKCGLPCGPPNPARPLTLSKTRTVKRERAILPRRHQIE